jgi:hypothetical protein
MRKSEKKNIPKAKHRRELASLKEENRILRAEIKRLNRVLRVHSSSKLSKKESKKEKSRERKLFEDVSSFSVAFTASSYFKYILSRISAASLYSLILKITKGFRRFRLFSSVIKISSSILAVLGTSAFFIFISGSLIFLIPLFLLICAAAYAASMIFRKKAFKELDSILENQTVFILFPTAARQLKKGSHLEKSLHLISNGTDEDVFTIVISPFLISGKGFSDNKYFPVMRMESNRLCIIRRNAFFALRRKLLSGRGDSVIYIY